MTQQKSISNDKQPSTTPDSAQDLHSLWYCPKHCFQMKSPFLLKQVRQGLNSLQEHPKDKGPVAESEPKDRIHVENGAGVGFGIGNGGSQELTPKPKLASPEVKRQLPEQD
ncbi:hypothetical protein DV515_00007800 [Chloebia gouldiae]|uniref:Uncharacterized protein n=1 Tax=Chloebia gouldiae TaxID=44316 RepID=A0A3L8SI11_CHLGU|nr:hypothetical protein DV515_00007800 [Chloebia gouldiae]